MTPIHTKLLAVEEPAELEPNGQTKTHPFRSITRHCHENATVSTLPSYHARLDFVGAFGNQSKSFSSQIVMGKVDRSAEVSENTRASIMGPVSTREAHNNRRLLLVD